MRQIDSAVQALVAGRPVVLLSGNEASTQGELVFPAQAAVPRIVAFAVRHTSGFLGVALAGEDCDRLELPPQVHAGPGRNRPSYAVTVDAKDGLSTGISATDRSRTIRLLASPACRATDLLRPGHVVPVRVSPAGVLGEASAPAAALELMRIAGLSPAAAMSTLTSGSGHGGIATLAELRQFSRCYRLPIVTIDDVIHWCQLHTGGLERSAERIVDTASGTRRAYTFRDRSTGIEHVAMVHGVVTASDDVVIRIHAECLASELFDAGACDCAARLAADLRIVSQAKVGLLIYVRAESQHQQLSVGAIATAEHISRALGAVRLAVAATATESSATELRHCR